MLFGREGLPIEQTFRNKVWNVKHSGLLCREAFVFESFLAFADDLLGMGGLTPAADFGAFAFELFVDSEEMLNFAKDVRGEVSMIVDLGVGGAANRNGQHLFVGYLLIQHFQNANGPGLDQATSEGGLKNQHEDVQGISVRRQCAGNETVIAGVMNRSVERAVESEDVQSLIVFVFVSLSAWDFDDGINDAGSMGASRQGQVIQPFAGFMGEHFKSRDTCKRRRKGCPILYRGA